MTDVGLHAALWLGLALLSIWLRVATALSEIVVGTVAQLIIGALAGTAFLGAAETWIKFLSGGHVVDQIICAAVEERADMIVMGHRGKSLAARWLLGSVSKRVISYAPVQY